MLLVFLMLSYAKNFRWRILNTNFIFFCKPFVRTLMPSLSLDSISVQLFNCLDIDTYNHFLFLWQKDLQKMWN